MRRMNKFLVLFLFSLSFLSLITLKFKVEAASKTITYDFEREEELSDFTPYFVKEEAGTDGVREEFKLRWKNEAGKVTSIRKDEGSGSTGNIAYLTLNKYLLKNFQIDLVMNYVDDSSWGWGGLSFRQKATGNGFRNDGCLAFVQREGIATLWGNDNFDGAVFQGNTPDTFDEKSPFRFRVKAVNKEVTVTVLSVDETVIYSEVTQTFSKDEAVDRGFISLTSIDNTHAFDELTINPLDDAGNPIYLQPIPRIETLDISSNQTTYSLGQEISLAIETTPQNVDLSELDWTTSNEEIAIVKDGSVIGINTGTVTITASSRFNESIKSALTLTFTEGVNSGLNYYFNDEQTFNEFRANYVRNASDSQAGNEEFTEHWELTDNNSLIRTNFDVGGPDENVASLYLKNHTFSNFEATLVYRNTTGAQGWIGINSGNRLENKRFIDDGQGFFIQREGIATIWGKDIGGPYEKLVPSYNLKDWHVLKVKVVGNEVYMYVDDLVNPVFTKTLDVLPQVGEIGVMTSGSAPMEIKSLAIKYLDEAGNPLDFDKISTIQIENKITEAVTGDDHPLVVVPEEVDEKTYTVFSSNKNICFYHNGILYFIGEGEVTISIISNLNVDAKDTMTIHVKKAATEPIYYYPEEAENKNNEEKPGIPNSTAIISCVALVGVTTLLIVVINKKKWSF